MGDSAQRFSSTMKIKVVEEDDVLELSVDPTETLAALKEKIQVDDGTSVDCQLLHYQGYLLNQDDICLGDFLKDGYELTMSTSNKGKDKAMFKNKVENDVWIVTGNEKRFKPYKLHANFRCPIKIKAGRFGLVYHIEGEQVGARQYQAYVYALKHDQVVELQGQHPNVEVFVNGVKQVPEDSELYDEKVVNQGSNLPAFLKFLGSFLNFVSRIGNIVDGQLN